MRPCWWCFGPVRTGAPVRPARGGCIRVLCPHRVAQCVLLTRKPANPAPVAQPQPPDPRRHVANRYSGGQRRPNDFLSDFGATGVQLRARRPGVAAAVERRKREPAYAARERRKVGRSRPCLRFLRPGRANASGGSPGPGGYVFLRDTQWTPRCARAANPDPPRGDAKSHEDHPSATARSIPSASA